MCGESKCLCGFPTVSAPTKYSKLVQPYIETLSEPTIKTCILFDALLKKTYQNPYKGIYFNISEDRGRHLLFVFSMPGKSLECLFTDDNGESDTMNWKSFKRGVDNHLNDTISCGICMEEWSKKNKDIVPSFWGCSNCANSVCMTCMKNIHDNCPYCRTPINE